MAFFDDLGKKLSDAGQTTIQKTKNLAEIARLNSSISDEERKIRNAYEQIGKQYVAVYGSCPEETFKGLVETIKESEGKIVEYKHNISVIKGVTKCPKCGAEVDNKATFCSSCGNEMAKAEPTQTEASVADEKVCRACGARVAAGCKFCTSCGNAF